MSDITAAKDAWVATLRNLVEARRTYDKARQEEGRLRARCDEAKKLTSDLKDQVTLAMEVTLGDPDDEIKAAIDRYAHALGSRSVLLMDLSRASDRANEALTRRNECDSDTEDAHRQFLTAVSLHAAREDAS